MGFLLDESPERARQGQQQREHREEKQPALGPLPPPEESAWIGSRPVRLTVTPGGTAALRAARVGLMKLTAVKLGMPAG